MIPDEWLERYERTAISTLEQLSRTCSDMDIRLRAAVALLEATDRIYARAEADEPGADDPDDEVIL